METLKFKHGIDYYFYKCMELKRKLEDATHDAEWRRKALDESNNKRPKKVSPFYVVFNQSAEGDYTDPKIVRADSPEEALCPEDTEEHTGMFCQRLLDASEYREI